MSNKKLPSSWAFIVVLNRAIPINKRVLIVGEFGSINGGENSLLAIAPRLIDFGWELHAAIPSPSKFATALTSAGILVHPWSVRDTDNSRKSAQQISSQLREVIAAVSPAILHFNSLSTTRIGGPIASQLRIPSLGYIRDIMKLSKKAISDLNQTDRIIAVSHATREFHIAQGIDPEKTIAIHNGVDTDLFHPADKSRADVPAQGNNIRTELKIPADVPILIFVGQLGMRKGVDTLIETFFNVAPKTDAHLVIIGQRHSQKQEAVEYIQNLHTKVESSRYRRRVHWLGRRTDVAGIMRQATILIHPARQEPLGRVLLESAASGLPLITTNVGGSPEILCGDEEGETSDQGRIGRNPESSDRACLDDLLVDVPTPKELNSSNRNDFDEQLRVRVARGIGRRIVALLENPDQLAEIRQQLRCRAVNSFSIEKCAGQIDLHYRDLFG